MTLHEHDRSPIAHWLIALAAAVGFVTAAVDYFTHGSGIDRTGGALLVLASTALIVIAALLRLAPAIRRRRWLGIILDVLLLLGIVGTGFAAYMLDSAVMVAAMVVALIGWIASMALPAAPRRSLRELLLWQ